MTQTSFSGIRDVVGYCPMGCGESLHLSPGGSVCCLESTCPDPNAVSKILSNDETEHIVVMGELDFVIKHPLRERVSDELFACELNEYLHSLPGAPVDPGKYRVSLDPDGPIGWKYEALP